MDFTDYLTVNTIQYDSINTRGMNSSLLCCSVVLVWLPELILVSFSFN